MTRFWLIYEPVLSATIVASVDQVLSVSTPAFLDSIRMTTFTLGTKPPHIDHVRTFPDTEDDIVLMEWKISFTPSDIMDMTLRAHAKQVNPKVCNHSFYSRFTRVAALTRCFGKRRSS